MEFILIYITTNCWIKSLCENATRKIAFVLVATVKEAYRIIISGLADAPTDHIHQGGANHHPTKGVHQPSQQRQPACDHQ